jgi:hypothetical protein
MSIVDGIGGMIKGGAELAGGLESLKEGNLGGGIAKLLEGAGDMKNGLMGMGATSQQANDIVSKVLANGLGGGQNQNAEGMEHHHKGLPPEEAQQLTQMLEQLMQELQQVQQGQGL